jgi:hypothetical protein
LQQERREQPPSLRLQLQESLQSYRTAARSAHSTATSTSSTNSTSTSSQQGQEGESRLFQGCWTSSLYEQAGNSGTAGGHPGQHTARFSNSLQR